MSFHFPKWEIKYVRMPWKHLLEESRVEQNRITIQYNSSIWKESTTTIWSNCPTKNLSMLLRAVFSCLLNSDRYGALITTRKSVLIVKQLVYCIHKSAFCLSQKRAELTFSASHNSHLAISTTYIYFRKYSNL